VCPSLLASLKEEPTNGATSLVIRVQDEAKGAQIQKLGLKDGDIVTRINRSPIASVDEARNALTSVSNDAGFSVRITRGGQSGWIRVNFSDAQPQPPTQEKPKEQAPVAPPAAPPTPQTPPVQQEAQDVPQPAAPAQPAQP
jgi:septum formation inhibitor MinC